MKEGNNRIICEVCEDAFYARYKNTKTCSDKCNKIRTNRITGRAVMGDKISHSSTGAMSELFVCGELLRIGYSVFRSVSPSCFCDVIAFKDGKIFKIEIRTGYIAKSGKLNHPSQISEDADCFGIYERNTGKVFFVDKDRKPITL